MGMFHSLFYGHLKFKNLMIGDHLLKENDDTNHVYIVEHGQLEVYLIQEGNEFIIERLNAGAILNYTAIFTDDNSFPIVRASKNTKILSLSEDAFKNLQDEYPEFKKKMLKHQHSILL